MRQWFLTSAVYIRCIFVCDDALHLSQQYISHFGIFNWVEPVLTKQRTKCPAQGNNTELLVRLEQATSQTQVGLPRLHM